MLNARLILGAFRYLARMADYYLLRKRIISLSDLFITAPTSCTGITAGYQAVAAWLMGIWPLLRNAAIEKFVGLELNSA